MTEEQRPTPADILRDLSELEEHELAEKYGLDESTAQYLKGVRAGLPLRRGAKNVATEEFWLRNVLKLLEESSIIARTRALEMLGKYLGIGDPKKNRVVKISFKEHAARERQVDDAPVSDEGTIPGPAQNHDDIGSV